MFINFAEKILNIDGEEIKIEQEPIFDDKTQKQVIEKGKLKFTDGKLLTLGLASVIALQNNYEDEKNISADEKLNRFTLALSIHKKEEPIEIKVEDISKIKTLIHKQFGTLVYARTANLFEGAK